MKNNAEKFWLLVDKKAPEECWPWLGALNSNGYGRHRKAYELTYGKVAIDLVVMHLCNNRVCCNPGHLKAGTQSENVKYTHSQGNFDRRKVSLSCRKTKPGTGVQFDKRYKIYNVRFKVLGKPLYIGVYKEKELALTIANAALEEVRKLMLTRENITYDDIKAHFLCLN